MTDKLVETLEPCERCGGQAVMRRDDDPGYPWYVTFEHDPECVMYAVPTDLFRAFATEAEAITAWNRRALASRPDTGAVAWADLLAKAVGDITAALIFAGKQGKIKAWTAPYVDALNQFDAHPPAAVAGEGKYSQTAWDEGAAKLISEAAKLVEPKDGEAVFYIRVGGSQTSLNVKTKGSVDPDAALQNAIAVLNGERADLSNCPVHALSQPARDALREALGMAQEVRDLLLERIQGSPARSAAHNARVRADSLIMLLSSMTPALASTKSPDADGVLRMIDGNEIWEALFGIMEGNVPDEMTDAVCQKLADHLRKGDSPPLLEVVAELARRDIMREQTDFIGRMHQAMGEFEAICDDHPDGDLGDAARDEAGEALASLAGLAIAQLAMVAQPDAPLAALSSPDTQAQGEGK